MECLVGLAINVVQPRLKVSVEELTGGSWEISDGGADDDFSYY